MPTCDKLAEKTVNHRPYHGNLSLNRLQRKGTSMYCLAAWDLVYGVRGAGDRHTTDKMSYQQPPRLGLSCSDWVSTRTLAQGRHGFMRLGSGNEACCQKKLRETSVYAARERRCSGPFDRDGSKTLFSPDSMQHACHVPYCIHYP